MNKNMNITERNIFEGEKANPQNCAIARAIKQEMKGKLRSVSVLATHIVIKTKKNEYTAVMPKEGTNFIKRFDRGLAVNSFKLNLKFKKQFALT